MPLLLERLTQPRGVLFIYEDPGAADDILVQSPASGFHCDARGGPTPILTDLSQVQGENSTYYVQWSCTTHISAKSKKLPETDPIGLTLDPLLSNRWVMTHHIRDGGFTDVEVEGAAVFDLGIVHRSGFNADRYRPKLLLPIPHGYERTDLVVTESEDGGTIHYHFMDKQVEIFFPAAVYVRATGIETEHRQYVLCDNDVLGGAIGLIDSALNRHWLAKQTGNDPASSAGPGRGKKKKKRKKPTVYPFTPSTGGSP